MARPSFTELEHHAQTLGGVMVHRLPVDDDVEATDDPRVGQPSLFLLEDEVDHERTAWGQLASANLCGNTRVDKTFTLSGLNPMYDPRQVYEDASDRFPSDENHDHVPLL